MIILLILLGAALVVLALRWPFTRSATIRSLEQVSRTEVQIGSFDKVFFPRPGYLAHDVTFRRGGVNSPPLARIEKVTCRGSWFALLTMTHRISRMDLEGLQIYIPAHVPPAIHKYPAAKIKTTVTDLFANGAVLEIAPRHAGSQTVRFDFPELALGNLAGNKATRFRMLMLNSGLIGRLGTVGAVGPLTLGRIAETQISGDYHIRQDDLSSHKVIAGILSADGRFSGTLGRTTITGRTNISNFEVTSSRHSVGVTAEYDALIDAIHGDVTIRSATAHFLRSTLIAHGSIVGREGKTVSVDIDGPHARVEDLLRLFVKAARPPLEGALDMHVHVILPPKREPFLRRVELKGGFAIKDAEFTKRTTEEKIDELSARARGEKKNAEYPEAVPIELKSDVTVEGGIAALSEAAFSVPGALVRGAGTYNLMNEAVDLRGKLAMQATLSKAARGIKSIALIPLDPFFKKNGAGAVVPVRIAGTYSRPVFKVLFTK